MGKDPEAGKDWGQEEKRATEDELIGWHHQLDGHEFEQTPGDGGQGSLASCSPWGHRVGHDWSDLACTHIDIGAKISHPGGGRVAKGNQQHLAGHLLRTGHYSFLGQNWATLFRQVRRAASPGREDGHLRVQYPPASSISFPVFRIPLPSQTVPSG